MKDESSDEEDENGEQNISVELEELKKAQEEKDGDDND